MSLLTQICHDRRLQQIQNAGERLNPYETLSMEALGVELQNQTSVSFPSPVSALLTTNTVEHRIRVISLGSHGVVCVGAPGVLPKGDMGLRLDDACENQSYLFRVSVSWIEHVSTESECRVGFDFIGDPVVLRWSRGRTPDAILELESALAA